MVRIEGEKIIIEINESSPCEFLEQLNKSLVDNIYNMDGNVLNGNIIAPILILIKELQPTWEQIKKTYDAEY